jgi:thiol-disulfide isomerase/thioredoxin
LNRAAAIALCVALVAAAGPAGFLLYRLVLGSRPPTLSAQPLATGASAGGEAPPGAASAGPAPRSPPERLPDIALPDPQGVMRRLSDWHGRPLLVNFWATWCEPCRREIPLLIGLRRRQAANGLQVVGIAVDMRDPVIAYARQMGIDYPILIGEQGGLAALDAFGMAPVFPFSVFADAQGRIVAVKLGELHPDEANLILSRVQALDSGRLSLAQARDEVSSGLRELATERSKGSAEASSKNTTRS